MMDDKITQEIMRLYNCCEDRAQAIISCFEIDSTEKLEKHIRFLAETILKNTKE